MAAMSHITLELAREPGHPHGDRGHGYHLYLPLTADGRTGTPEALYTGEFGRLRGVVATPDRSALWVTTSNRDGRGSPAPDDDRILVVPL